MATGKTLVLVVAAALGGGVVGGLVVGARTPTGEPGEAAPAAADGESATAPERVADLDRRLALLERRASRRRASTGAAAPAGSDAPEGGPPPTDAEESPLAAGSESDEVFGRLGLVPPDDDFVAQVAAALEVIEQRRKDRRRLEQVEKRRDGFLRDLDKKLGNYKSALELSDQEIADYRGVAEAYMDERIAAQQGGADQQALEKMDREVRRDIQAMLGDTRYRKLRALEIDAIARPVIVDASNRAGVTPEQRTRIETLLESHIGRIVDYDVRLRTEELPDETRTQLRDEMNGLNRAAWDSLRNDILTDEQRKRVPERR